MKALIIAAGAGSRLRDRGDIKPLVEVAGRPLIEHVGERVAAAGLAGLVVVTGYKAETLEAFLPAMSDRIGLPVTIVRNDGWERGNGTSVLAARPVLVEPFALMMSDHLFEPAILRDLVASPRERADVVLGVDRRLDNPLVDLEDVTRVLVRGDRIVKLGKLIEAYNAFDTGLFCCTPALFPALESAIAAGSYSLSGGVQRLADEGRAAVFDVGGRFWIDVDDPPSWDKATRLLMATGDGAYSLSA